jgi:hypothetical protein
MKTLIILAALGFSGWMLWRFHFKKTPQKPFVPREDENKPYPGSDQKDPEGQSV